MVYLNSPNTEDQKYDKNSPAIKEIPFGCFDPKNWDLTVQENSKRGLPT